MGPVGAPDASLWRKNGRRAGVTGKGAVMKHDYYSYIKRAAFENPKNEAVLLGG